MMRLILAIPHVTTKQKSAYRFAWWIQIWILLIGAALHNLRNINIITFSLFFGFAYVFTISSYKPKPKTRCNRAENIVSKKNQTSECKVKKRKTCICFAFKSVVGNKLTGERPRVDANESFCDATSSHNSNFSDLFDKLSFVSKTTIFFLVFLLRLLLRFCVIWMR